MDKKFLSRRRFLKTSSAIGAVGLTGGTSLHALAGSAAEPLRPAMPKPFTPLINPLSISPEELAENEDFWTDVAKNYNITDEVTNLENGYWGIMSHKVMDEYKKNTEFVNHDNTYFARLSNYKAMVGVREQVAEFLGVEREEIELTRGATETLQSLIGGYNKLKAGDAVLYADLDYSEMKNAMDWLETRRGVEVIKINFPEPVTKQAILDLYEQAFEDHPNIKMTLLTHLNNLTGLIAPIKDIAALAKVKGIDCILDAAHSLGHVDFSLRDLGCDFVGINLHKWIGAPIGCGLMYIKKDRIPDIDPYMSKPDPNGSITARMDTGTSNFAAYLTIPEAIKYHISLGTPAKEARLRYLRTKWVKGVQTLSHIDVLTPNDASMVAGITSFRVKGKTSTEENNALVKSLLKDHGILTVRRTGPVKGDCVRVTPAIYTGTRDVDKLVKALKNLS
jgi:selenocysteine lyase/cysteine desulfurase